MKPREVFDAMRPYYPTWPATFDEATELTKATCRAIAKDPERLNAWLQQQGPPPAPRGRSFVVSRKPFTGIDGKSRAAGERPDNDESDE